MATNSMIRGKSFPLINISGNPLFFFSLILENKSIPMFLLDYSFMTNNYLFDK